MGGIVADDLGYNGHGRVVFRQDIREMGGFDAAGLRGRDKGCDGGVESVKMPAKRIAEDMVGKTLQGRKIQFECHLYKNLVFLKLVSHE